MATSAKANRENGVAAMQASTCTVAGAKINRAAPSAVIARLVRAIQ